jgi:hypothetical protein
MIAKKQKISNVVSMESHDSKTYVIIISLHRHHNRHKGINPRYLSSHQN